MRHRQRAMTLVEVLVVVAVLAVMALIAAPSFRDFLLMQRLKSVNAQIVTDLQFARSEATSRSRLLRMSFTANDEMTCYVLYLVKGIDDTAANAQTCDCSLGADAACSTSALMTEVRTVQVPRSLSVQIAVPTGWPTEFAFDPVTGGLMSVPPDNPSAPMDSALAIASIDTARSLVTLVNRAGRPTVCIPTGSTMAGDAC